jgi:hypothetical protein
VFLKSGRSGQNPRFQVGTEAYCVLGHRGQIGEQGAKAVDRMAVLGALAGALRCAAGDTLALATGERRRAWAAARSWSSNSEQAQKNMGADAILVPMVDGPHLEIDGFGAAKGAFDVREMGSALRPREAQPAVNPLQSRFAAEFFPLQFRCVNASARRLSA